MHGSGNTRVHDGKSNPRPVIPIDLANSLHETHTTFCAVSRVTMTIVPRHAFVNRPIVAHGARNLAATTVTLFQSSFLRILGRRGQSNQHGFHRLFRRFDGILHLQGWACPREDADPDFSPTVVEIARIPVA